MDCIDGMKEHLSVTVPRDVADMVKELMELSGWDKSRCVSEGLRIGLPELIKRIKKKVMETEKKKADKPTPEDEERAREEYWRKVILGKIHSDRWVPV
jgi:phosphoenolpyruvate carboxylase